MRTRAGRGGNWFLSALSLIVLGVVIGIAITSWEPISAMHPAYGITLAVAGAAAVAGLVSAGWSWHRR
ncbi:hypothetical protein QFW96_27955 [Saccharopolyspora sp. TS4A08]|uniref:Uncharacterized protein n=1 Tax=Saccharopolyspora ipomoeae TaxID=3042027 RepID=A0ABT6PWU9_9PSEU|nr:hypothetical protein [Saccharopolyspora sp. TS4A08]MDI2032485.1 hypothetical protein [Saccharopolyspora sp. TS4A08]